jgi:hypothetical protein
MPSATRPSPATRPAAAAGEPALTAPTTAKGSTPAHAAGRADEDAGGAGVDAAAPPSYCVCRGSLVFYTHRARACAAVLVVNMADGSAHSATNETVHSASASVIVRDAFFFIFANINKKIFFKIN